MSLRTATLFAAVCLFLTACDPDAATRIPAPREPGPGDTGTICRMDMTEHAGPKGQIYLKSRDGVADQPLWFSSVRDTFTWLLMDGGADQTVAAVWVNDMGHDADWNHPPAGAWVDAKKAWFVIGSDKAVSMNSVAELVPFSDHAAAQAFAAVHGGSVVPFQKIDHALLESGALPPATH